MLMYLRFYDYYFMMSEMLFLLRLFMIMMFYVCFGLMMM